MFIEGFELADEGSSVLQNDAHSIIQMRRHLVTLAHRHLEGSVGAKARKRENGNKFLKKKFFPPFVLSVNRINPVN